jgi:hypothetical protein
MLTLYRSLLYLYPSAYRAEFGNEMMSVLSDLHFELRHETLWKRLFRSLHEVAGLLSGAFQQHVRALTGSYLYISSPRRFPMRSEFRFPKSAVALMTLILVAILYAIDQARSIQLSIPPSHTDVGPIKSAEFTAVPSMFIAVIGAFFIGAVAWAVIFALRRSGMQRFSQVDPAHTPRTGN